MKPKYKWRGLWFEPETEAISRYKVSDKFIQLRGKHRAQLGLAPGPKKCLPSARERALLLMQTTELPVKAIAAEVGASYTAVARWKRERQNAGV